MLKELQLLGLTENESQVYEALVELGPCKAGALIARLSIHRNIVYRCLDDLAVNGYITKIVKNGVWHFQISDPQSFLISAHRKELVLGELTKMIGERQQRISSQIVVYEGVASYRNYWLRSLERFPDGTVDYVAGSKVAGWEDIMGKERIDEYVRMLHKKKMTWKLLYFTQLSELEKKLLRATKVPTECRVWEPHDETFFGNFNVLADTVILHTTTGIPRIIEMRDKMLVTMFQHLFDRMWEKATPVELSVREMDKEIKTT